jgi:hypothetical protein
MSAMVAPPALTVIALPVHGSGAEFANTSMVYAPGSNDSE